MKSITEMTMTELTDLIAEATAQIETMKNANNLVHIVWSGEVADARKGKPYFAILSRGEGKFAYNFVSDSEYSSKKPNAAVFAKFEGDLPAGTVVRYRAGASWKNDYTFYAVVDASAENNLREIGELEAKKLIGITHATRTATTQPVTPQPETRDDDNSNEDYDGYDAAESTGHYATRSERANLRRYGM